MPCFHAFLRHLGLVALMLPAMPVVAEPAPGAEREALDEPQRLERVEVAATRGSVMPYASWVRAAQPVHALSRGQIRQGVRLYSRDKGRALRVSVDDDARSETIAPLLGELYVVPHDLALDLAQADLSVNRADGQWGVGNFALVPQLPSREPELAQVREVLDGYQAVYRQRFPLSWRLLSRAEASLDVCLPQAGGRLRVTAVDGALLAELPLDRSPQEHAQTTGLQLFCASLRPERGWDPRARLQLPEQAVVLLGFRLL